MPVPLRFAGHASLSLPASVSPGTAGLIIPPWLPGAGGSDDDKDKGGSLIDPGGTASGLANLLATDWKEAVIRLGIGLAGVLLIIAGVYLVGGDVLVSRLGSEARKVLKGLKK